MLLCRMDIIKGSADILYKQVWHLRAHVVSNIYIQWWHKLKAIAILEYSEMGFGVHGVVFTCNLALEDRYIYSFQMQKSALIWCIPYIFDKVNQSVSSKIINVTCFIVYTGRNCVLVLFVIAGNILSGNMEDTCCCHVVLYCSSSHHETAR